METKAHIYQVLYQGYCAASRVELCLSIGRSPLKPSTTFCVSELSTLSLMLAGKGKKTVSQLSKAIRSIRSQISQVLETNSVDLRKKRLVADLFWRLVMTLAESQMIFAKSTDRLDLVRKYGFATPLLVFRSLVQNAIAYQKAASTCFYHIRLLHAIDIMEARPVQTVRSKLHAGGWYCADHRIYDLLEVKVGRPKGLWALASHSALASQMKRMKRCAAVPGDVHSPMARWRQRSFEWEVCHQRIPLDLNMVSWSGFSEAIWSAKSELSITLWLFNIAMENGP